METFLVIKSCSNRFLLPMALIGFKLRH